MNAGGAGRLGYCRAGGVAAASRIGACVVVAAKVGVGVVVVFSATGRMTGRAVARWAWTLPDAASNPISKAAPAIKDWRMSDLPNGQRPEAATTTHQQLKPNRTHYQLFRRGRQTAGRGGCSPQKM